MPTKPELLKKIQELEAQALIDIANIARLEGTKTLHKDIINDKNIEIQKMHSEYDAKMTQASECFDTAICMLCTDIESPIGLSPELRAFHRVMKIFTRPEDVKLRKTKVAELFRERKTKGKPNENNNRD